MTGNGEEQPSVEQSEGQLKVDSRDEMYDELVHLQKLFYVDPQTRKVVVIRTEKCFLWT